MDSVQRNKTFLWQLHLGCCCCCCFFHSVGIVYACNWYTCAWLTCLRLKDSNKIYGKNNNNQSHYIDELNMNRKIKYIQLKTIAQMVHFRLLNYFVRSFVHFFLLCIMCFVCVRCFFSLPFCAQRTDGIIDVWIDVSYGFDLSWFVLHFYGLFIAFIIGVLPPIMCWPYCSSLLLLLLLFESSLLVAYCWVHLCRHFAETWSQSIHLWLKWKLSSNPSRRANKFNCFVILFSSENVCAW